MNTAMKSKRQDRHKNISDKLVLLFLIQKMGVKSVKLSWDNLVVSNKNFKMETKINLKDEGKLCLLHMFKIFFKFPALWLYYFYILNKNTKIFLKI